MKHKLRIDDALDVSSVHGLTGVIGSLFVGFAAETAVNPVVGNGVVFGGTRQIWVQFVAVAVAAVYAGVITYILCVVINKTVGLKIDHEDEVVGLDIVEHGEYAYHNLWLAGPEPHYEPVGFSGSSAHLIQR